jgi:H+/Na+-translocating ferredoxin:NAD+ oxidoreductase subunit G
MLGQSISRNAVLLGLFALTTTTLIAGTYLLTKDRIALEQRKAEERALLEIVPRDKHDNQLLDDTLLPAASLAITDDRVIYLARMNGQVVTAILPVTAPDGYSGSINLIVGINRDGSVAGVRVLSHKETPGLGDKVDLKKSDWILDFNGRSLGSPQRAGWAVKKDRGDFDQFTGATITPRAVVAAVLRALDYAAEQSDSLYNQPQPQSDAGE